MASQNLVLDSGLAVTGSNPSRHREGGVGVLLLGGENQAVGIASLHAIMIVITCQAQFQAFYMIYLINPHTALGCECCPHFTDEETEAWEVYVTCLMSHRK